MNDVFFAELTRNQMIQLALLVGSDYTNGISGIGPVTALEILAAFPCEGEDLLRGLIKFSDCINAGRFASPFKLGAGLRNKLQSVKVDRGIVCIKYSEKNVCSLV